MPAIVWIAIGIFVASAMFFMGVFIAQFVSDIYPELVRIATNFLRKF